MSATSEKIRAALTGRTTGLTSLEIREASKLPSSALFSVTLRDMTKRGEIIKRAGATRVDSRYTLNPEHGANPPPARPKKSASKKRAKKPAPPQRRKAKKGKRRDRPPSAAAAPAPAVADSFVPAMTADGELLVISAGAPPQIFPAEHTQRIATLMLQHFNPG